MKRKIVLIVAIVIFTGVPYFYAWLSAGHNFVFGGVLFNPTDGNSYLAKMYEGWSGQWRFTLPYTANPGKGAYLYLFYMLLGHISQLFHLSLILVYNLARLAGNIFLVIAIYRYFQTTMKDNEIAWSGALLAILGSGLGWIALIFGKYTSDLWVSEAYPLLSMLTNPHFPISLGIMLWLLGEDKQTITLASAIETTILALILAIISPFCVFVAGLIWLCLLIWEQLELKPLTIRPQIWAGLGCFIIGAAPMALYQYWAMNTDPVLAGWNRQNVTPSPPLYDLIISFSPAILLALVGGYGVVRKKVQVGRDFLIWFILAIILVYLPTNLQRRLMVGLYVPIAGLAVLGVEVIRRTNWSSIKWLLRLLIPVSAPTILVIVILAFYGIVTHDSKLYLTRDEMDGLNWILVNTPQNALILAGPDAGLVIPAYTGRRVVYGHPYETVNAAQEKAGVVDFFSGSDTPAQADTYLKQKSIQYIFYGPNEVILGKPSDLNQYPVVFHHDSVTIYEVAK